MSPNFEYVEKILHKIQCISKDLIKRTSIISKNWRKKFTKNSKHSITLQVSQVYYETRVGIWLYSTELHSPENLELQRRNKLCHFELAEMFDRLCVQGGQLK